MFLLQITWQQFLGYFSIFSLSSVKFLIGLIGAVGANYNTAEILLVAGGGAWAGSWVYALFGEQIRKWFQRTFKREPMPFGRRRRIIKIWKKYGLPGVSFLSIVISPMIAIGVALSFRERPLRIMTYMTAAILFWSLVFAFFKELVIEYLV